MSKRIILSLILLACLMLPTVYAAEDTVQVHLFYGSGCTHCEKMKLFLYDIDDNYPDLVIHEHEIYHNNDERLLFHDLCSAYGKDVSGVPTLFIGNNVIVGYSDSKAKEVEDRIKQCSDFGCIDPLSKLQSSKAAVESSTENATAKTEEKRVLGNKLTIPIVVLAAAVDAINPCAFAVLIILMSAALAITDKKRALRFGLAFSAAIYIAYFLLGLGLFSALQMSGLSHYFYIAITVLAVIVGLLNVKDYFWYGKGFLMEVPLSWRPAMKKLLRSATSPLGAFFVGFLVSLFELPCTGGPYIVILGLLATEVTRTTGILYLLLYNLVFISPLIILTLIIYKGLSTTDKLEKIRQKRIRLLHLIAGILMLTIAAIMIYSLSVGWV